MKKLTSEEALNKVIDAWEALDAGEYLPNVIGDWLHETMKPAMDEARKAIGRKIPSTRHLVVKPEAKESMAKNRFVLHLTNGESLYVECDEDEYTDDYDQFMNESGIIAFDDACVRARDIIAIEYLEDKKDGC